MSFNCIVGSMRSFVLLYSFTRVFHPSLRLTFPNSSLSLPHSYMEQWTMEDITPYIKEFTMDTLSLDQLLLKEARAIRSTKLPPGPDGKPIMVYTRR